MNAWLKEPTVFRTSTGRFIVSQDAMAEVDEAMGFSMHLSRKAAISLRDELTAQLAEQANEHAKATYSPSVVAECIDLTAATGPMRPVDLEETAARR